MTRDDSGSGFRRGSLLAIVQLLSFLQQGVSLQMPHCRTLLARQAAKALEPEQTEDAGASARRKPAAAQRAAREGEQGLAAALATMDKLQRKPPPEVKRSRRRGRQGDDDPGSPGAPEVEPEPERQPRIGATDADARAMKRAGGGFRIAFNAQLAVNAQTQLIAAVGLSNSGSDLAQMSPLHPDIQPRYDLTPAHSLADGGIAKLSAIGGLTAQAQWRTFMPSDFAKALWVQRSASLECANARLWRRGLCRFNVCGLVKARAVLLWHALAHNLMRMRILQIAFAA